MKISKHMQRWLIIYKLAKSKGGSDKEAAKAAQFCDLYFDLLKGHNNDYTR